MRRFFMFVLPARSRLVVPYAKAQSTAQESHQARLKAHEDDFDYLLGDWQFTAKSKEYGTFSGVWSAVRLPQGQILDEYRVLATTARRST